MWPPVLLYNLSPDCLLIIFFQPYSVFLLLHPAAVSPPLPTLLDSQCFHLYGFVMNYLWIEWSVNICHPHQILTLEFEHVTGTKLSVVYNVWGLGLSHLELL